MAQQIKVNKPRGGVSHFLAAAKSRTFQAYSLTQLSIYLLDHNIRVAVQLV